MTLDYGAGIRLMPPYCGGGIRLFDKIPSLGERYVSDFIWGRDKDDNKKREWTNEKEDVEASLALAEEKLRQISLHEEEMSLAVAAEKLRQISLHEDVCTGDEKGHYTNWTNSLVENKEMSLAVAAERFRQRLRRGRRMRKRIKRPGLSQRKVTKFKHPPISQWRWRREKVTKAFLDKKKVYFTHWRHGETEYEEIPLSLAVEIFRGQISDYDPAFLVRGQEKVDHKAWVKYQDQLYRSNRFDIEDYPGTALAATVIPVRRDRIFHILPRMKEYATLALTGYNTKEGENYQVKDIVSVNVTAVGGFIYYITCEAINCNAGDAPEIFQIQINDIVGRDAEVALCRKKP